MSVKQQTRKNKIDLLKGVMAGTISLKELVPDAKYFVFSDEEGHHVSDWSTKEITDEENRVMNDEEFEQWKQRKGHFIKVHLIEAEPDERDEPIND